MEERAQIQKKKSEKKPKGDYYTKVTLLQIALCLLLSLVCFAVSRSGGEAASNLHVDFESLMQWELTIEDAREVWTSLCEKLETAEVFGSAAQTVLAESSADSPTEKADETKPAEPEPTTAEEAEADSKAETEKKASKQETTEQTEDGAGGEDASAPETAETAAVSVSSLQRIVRPVAGGRYSSQYGYRTNPITHEYSFHTGLDIAVAQGTKIVAAYRGRVARTGQDERAGKYIVLSHAGGCETVYCHCSRILASEGDSVRAGDAIALVGSTGWSTGPHLHFEIRKDGERMDPYPLLEHEV